MNSNHMQHNLDHIGMLEKRIERLSDQEELHWNQRARVNWLKSGDHNTKFFHASASKRRKQNLIKGLLTRMEIGVLNSKT